MDMLGKELPMYTVTANGLGVGYNHLIYRASQNIAIFQIVLYPTTKIAHTRAFCDVKTGIEIKRLQLRQKEFPPRVFEESVYISSSYV